MMTSPKFSTWRPNQGKRSKRSFLRLEMTFSHSTLGAASLIDEEAHECEKMATGEVACSLEVKRLKTGVFQLKDLPDKAQNI